MMKLTVALLIFANAPSLNMFWNTRFHLSTLCIAIGFVVEMKRGSELQLLTAVVTQGDSVARGPKLLSIKNYVVEIMT